VESTQNETTRSVLNQKLFKNFRKKKEVKTKKQNFYESNQFF